MLFERPWLLYAAPALTLAAAFAARAIRARRIARAARWSPALEAVARRGGRETWVVVGLVVLCALVAAAGPRWGRRLVTTEQRSLDVVFAVDVSKSMLAEDARPSRLRRAAGELRRLLQDLEGDRVGLIAFSGRSYILSPLTVDASAVRLFVDALDPDLASEGGTTLSRALQQGGELLAASGGRGDKALVLFTDGESHEDAGEAVARAEALRKQGVTLILVAEGGTVPVRIPVRDTLGRFLEWQVDRNGEEIRTGRQDALLTALKEAADAVVIPAEAPDQAGAVRAVLAGLERAAGTETRAADLVPRAWVPALVGALLLALGTALRGGRALLGLVLLWGWTSGPAHAQRPGRAERLARRGDAEAARAAYLREAASGAARDTALYNAGTAALAAGKLDEARQAFAEAARTVDPGLRYRALYNAGVAALQAARKDRAKADALYGEAEQRLREALLLEPAAARAKWNLELARREKPPTPPTPQGGGGGSGGGSGGSPPPQSMDRRQADQLLESMERQERETRLAQQRRSARAGGVKDW
jgi:Ca-activated chloride channel family protein